MWPSSGHAMMDTAFHAEDMRLFRSLLALHMLDLWRQRDKESMTNAIAGCSAAFPKSRFHDRPHERSSLPD
jgi:hypothetical protein